MTTRISSEGCWGDSERFSDLLSGKSIMVGTIVPESPALRAAKTAGGKWTSQSTCFHNSTRETQICDIVYVHLGYIAEIEQGQA